MEFSEGHIRVTVRIGEEDVKTWTEELVGWDEGITSNEVRSAAQWLIAERGINEYRTAMQGGLDTVTREIMLRRIRDDREIVQGQTVDEPIYVGPDSDRCQRTDGICWIKRLANRDCRTCGQFLG